MYLIIINIICILDTIIKYKLNKTSELYKSNFIKLYLTKVENHGFSLSLLKILPDLSKKMLHIMSIIIIGIIYGITGSSITLIIFISSFYNLFDRIKNGYIIDYICLKVLDKYVLTFNIIDIIISMSVMILLICQIDNSKN